MRKTATAIALVLGVTAAWWWNQPRTPAELLDDRCSDCHVVPNMTLLERLEMGQLITIMRETHGAKQGITDAEAQMIIDFVAKRKAR